MLFPKPDPLNAGETDPLASCCPSRSRAWCSRRNGFHVTLTSEGKDNPLLQMDDRKAEAPGPDAPGGPQPAGSIWQQLPPH